MIGAILPSPEFAPPPYMAAAKMLPPPVWPYSGVAVGTAGGGTLASNLPYAVSPVTFAGAIYPQFSQHWYNTIHMLPSSFALGNLLSTQVRRIEVWNGHFTPQTLSAIVGQNDGGVTLAGPANPPTTYGVLESRFYDISIVPDGPPVIEAVFTFQFPTEAPQLKITGRRVVVFGLDPDWSDGILERLEWATQVLTARDGSEQRIALRQTPRRTLEFSIAADADAAAMLDVLLCAWQSRVYALPMWTDKTRLSTAVAAGASFIPVATTNFEYETDGLVVIGTSAATSEAAEVLSVAANGVTLKQPLLRSWPKGAFVVPSRTARLRVTQAVTRPTAGIVRARLAFDIVGSTSLTKKAGTATYASMEVFTRKPNRAKDVEAEYQRQVERIDFATGIVALDDHAAKPFIRRAFEYLLRTRADIGDVKGWLAVRQGRQTPYWLPTWERAIEPVKKILSNETVMVIRSRGYAMYFNPMAGRTDVAMLHKNGTWYFRAVTGFGAGDNANEERMLISSALGVDVNPTEWQIICFLEKSRLDTDLVEVHWESDSVAQVALPMRSLP